MTHRIPTLLKRHFVFPYAVYKTLLCKSSYLNSSGWMKSLQNGKPTTADGSSLPWMNYPVINFLENRLTKAHDLFEFGSGYSTRFYASLVRSVTSVEYDAAWCKRVAAELPANVELIHQPADLDGEYCRVIHRNQKQYDVVVVDGYDRNNCIYQTLSCLKDSGVIVLDDSSRDDYNPAIAETRRLGFRALEFVGIKPTSCKMHQTTILYRDGNTFGL